MRHTLRKAPAAFAERHTSTLARNSLLMDVDGLRRVAGGREVDCRLGDVEEDMGEGKATKLGYRRGQQHEEI